MVNAVLIYCCPSGPSGMPMLPRLAAAQVGAAGLRSERLGRPRGKRGQDLHPVRERERERPKSVKETLRGNLTSM